MNKQSELAIVRRAYAKQVLAAAGVKEPRRESAYDHVSREYFLGQGPWPIFRWWWGAYTESPDDNPVYLYTNDVIGIDPGRRINNGEPALHANLITAAEEKKKRQANVTVDLEVDATTKPVDLAHQD